MKIKQTNKNKIIVSISVLLLIVASIMIVWNMFNKNVNINSPENTTTEQLNQPEEIHNPPKETEQKNQENTDFKTTETNSDKPIQPKENPDHTYTVSMISSIEIENGSVFIRGGINNLSSDSGKCTAEMIHKDGTIIEKTTTLLSGPQSSSCKTIEVPIKELKSGEWIMKLKYKNQNTTGETDEKKFTIKQ